VSGCADPAFPYVEHVVPGSEGLHVDGYRRILGGEATGSFAEADTELVRRFQREAGLRETGAIGPATHTALTERADEDARRLVHDEYSRRHPHRTARGLAVLASFAALDRRGEMVYSGPGRPTVARRWQGIEEEIEPPAAPDHADCSSLATWCLWVGRAYGSSDPSRRGWAPGSTATMEPHGRAVALGESQPGALLFYARAGLGGHVAMLVERVRGVPFVVSFGAEGGPEYVRWDYRRERFGADDLTSVRDYVD
jgi:Putative peptidoglycan binding domain